MAIHSLTYITEFLNILIKNMVTAARPKHRNRYSKNITMWLNKKGNVHRYKWMFWLKSLSPEKKEQLARMVFLIFSSHSVAPLPFPHPKNGGYPFLMFIINCLCVITSFKPLKITDLGCPRYFQYFFYRSKCLWLQGTFLLVYWFAGFTVI